MQIRLFNKNRFIHSIKTAFAVLIGFAITKLLHFAVDQWLIITILVVMCAQISVGSMIHKSYMRFLGTLTGSLIAGGTLYFFGTDHLATAISIALSSILFSYIATSQKNYNELGTLGAVTVAIILIGQDPTIITAVERCLEITFGIIIAALVSQFMLPIHAKRDLRLNQAQTIRQLRAYYQTSLLAEQKDSDNQELQSVDEKIVKSLITQRKLAVEAMREPIGKAYNTKLFDQSLWCEKEILRSIIFMQHAYSFSENIRQLLSKLDIIKTFHQEICNALDTISLCLEKKVSNITIKLPDLKQLNESIQSEIKFPTSTDSVYINGFLFCAEILISRMNQLMDLVTEMNLPEGNGI